MARPKYPTDPCARLSAWSGAYRRSSSSVCIVLALALIPAPAAAQIRDSAGISIATNRFPLPPAEGRWRLSVEPILDIGGGAPDGPYDRRGFQMVRTEHGHLIVTNAATFDVRVYDSLGQHIGTVGRRGEGPNEFKSFRLIPAGNGKAMSFDQSLQRMTWIDDHGRLGPMVPLPTTMSRPGQSRVPIALLSDGTMISTEGIFWTFAANSQDRDTTVFVRSRQGWTTHTAFAKAAGVEVRPSPTRPGVTSPVVFGRGEVHAFGGGRLYLARNNTWEIEVLRVDGTLAQLIRLGVPTQPITAARERQLRARVLARNPTLSPERRAGFKTLDDSRPYARSFPPITRILVAPDRTLFVQPGGDPEAPAVLDIFRPNGIYTGRLELPSGFEVLAVTASMLFGRISDPDGIEHLVGYALSRGRVR